MRRGGRDLLNGKWAVGWDNSEQVKAWWREVGRRKKGFWLKQTHSSHFDILNFTIHCAEQPEQQLNKGSVESLV